MHIIIRACGERTESKAIELAKLQGEVHVVRTQPFGECLRQSYKLASGIANLHNQEFIPMIDADVLLAPGTIARGIAYLKKCKSTTFCLDGKTKDKIMMRKRRAGIHIYRTALLPMALKYIDDNKIKPESHVRHCMEKLGYKTVVGKIVFGYHDYEQYYHDLWRKAICQAHKLPGTIRRNSTKEKWRKLAAKDPDYRVILAAHRHGTSLKKRPVIDARLTYGAAEGLKKLGIQEKREL